jgi:hypothetical protein
MPITCGGSHLVGDFYYLLMKCRDARVPEPFGPKEYRPLFSVKTADDLVGAYPDLLKRPELAIEALSLVGLSYTDEMRENGWPNVATIPMLGESCEWEW